MKLSVAWMRIQGSLGSFDITWTNSRYRCFFRSREESLNLLLKLAVGLGVPESYAKILRGTAQVTGDLGINIRVADILRHLSVSRRTYYQFFRTREDAQKTLYALIQIMIRIGLEKKLQDCKGLDQLFKVIYEGYIDLCSVSGRLLGYLTAEAVGRFSLLHPLYAHHINKCSQIINRRCVGNFHVDIPDALLRGYLLTLVGYAMNSIFGHPSQSEDLRNIMADYTRVFSYWS